MNKSTHSKEKSPENHFLKKITASKGFTFINNYKYELIIEILIIASLLILSYYGVYHFSASINNDGAFTVGMLLLPVTIISYVHVKQQELYDSLLEKIWTLPDSNAVKPLNENILKLKLLQLKALYEASRHSLPNKSAFEEVTIGIYYMLHLQGVRLDPKGDIASINRTLSSIDRRLKDNAGVFPINHGKAEQDPTHEQTELHKNFERVFWKGSVRMASPDEAVSISKYDVFYHTKFFISDKDSRVPIADIQNIMQAMLIAPVFNLDNVENQEEFTTQLTSTLDDSVLDPCVSFTDRKDGRDEEILDHLTPFIDEGTHKEPKIHVTITKDSRDIINRRPEMRRAYANGGQAIVRFSTTFSNKGDDYEWHTWFGLTSKVINQLRQSQTIKQVKFVVDGAPFNGDKKPTTISSNRILTFDKKDLLNLFDLKEPSSQGASPDSKIFFYFNFTDGTQNKPAELIDTRDIKDKDEVTIEVIDGEVKPIAVD